MKETPNGEFVSFASATIGGTEEGRSFDFDAWKPNRPRSNKEIWRYRSLDQYRSILEDEYLWFSRPDQFDDPFEGSIPSKNAESRMQNYDTEIASARSEFRYTYRYTTYLSCWYSEQHESDAMWRLYSDDNGGLAIKSTPDQLKTAIVQSEADIERSDIVDGDVEYQNYDRFNIESDSPIAPLFYKRKAFRFENEYRVLLHFTSDSFHGATVENIDNDQPKGIPVLVNIERLIDEVVISPDASNTFENEVEEVTEKSGYDIKVTKSNLYKDPYF